MALRPQLDHSVSLRIFAYLSIMKLAFSFSFSFLVLSVFSLSDATHQKRWAIPTVYPNGGFMKSSFTVYAAGAGDSCAKRMACGMHGSRHTAAINKMYYGAEMGQGAGSGCGRCWLIRNFTNTDGGVLKNPWSGKPIPQKSLVIYIDNMCPPGGSEVCGQNPDNLYNRYGAAVHFDLCHCTGTQEAIVGNSGLGQFLGEAQLLNDCSQWEGHVIDKPWNIPSYQYPYGGGKQMWGN